jgi:Glyoxalase-like domain
MSVDLFAGIPVSSRAQAMPWYEQLFGFAPSFFPNDLEAVWEVADHRYLYVVELPERPGHAVHLLFVDDLDARVTDIEARGLRPSLQETYDNGVRKVTYRDPDGNEVSFGGGPA